MKQDNRRGLVDGTWLLQILAILASAFSMAAIGILLAHYNDQPIFDWNGITLNAIIVVLSAISKTTLAFTLSECLGQAKWIWLSKERPLNDINLIDSASRGPLGSFKILTHSVARSFISMGAIIIMLSVVIDPFVQLTVGKKDSVKYEKSSKIQIPYAQRYDRGSLELKTNSGDGDGGIVDLLELVGVDLGMETAVNDGLSQPDSLISQQIQPSCPSGNCTWDQFMSLAVCSACNNLTNQIEPWELDDGKEIKIRGGQLPNGLMIQRYTPMIAYGSGNENNSVSFTSHDTLIWSMTMMMDRKDVMNEDFLDDYYAIECGLWYCVNNYQSAVKDGILTEIIEPAFSGREPDSWRPFVAGDALKEADPSYRFSKSINVFDNSTVFRSSTSSHDLVWINAVERTDLQLGDGFNLSQAAIYSVGKLMNGTFVEPGGLTTVPDIPSGNANAVVYDLENNNGGASIISYHPTAMQSLYDSQNFSKTFASVAKSMTNHMRQNSDNSTVVHGNEGRMIVVFRIRGRFLILPVILIFGGAVFLAVTLYYTHKFKIPFWGTNALPIVALGGRMGSIFDENDMMKTSTMERQAKHLLVQPSFLEPD